MCLEKYHIARGEKERATKRCPKPKKKKEKEHFQAQAASSDVKWRRPPIFFITAAHFLCSNNNTHKIMPLLSDSHCASVPLFTCHSSLPACCLIIMHIHLILLHTHTHTAHTGGRLRHIFKTLFFFITITQASKARG
jgi:hypothetical protein